MCSYMDHPPYDHPEDVDTDKKIHETEDVAVEEEVCPHCFRYILHKTTCPTYRAEISTRAR